MSGHTMTKCLCAAMAMLLGSCVTTRAEERPLSNDGFVARASCEKTYLEVFGAALRDVSFEGSHAEVLSRVAAALPTRFRSLLSPNDEMRLPRMNSSTTSEKDKVRLLADLDQRFERANLCGVDRKFALLNFYLFARALDQYLKSRQFDFRGTLGASAEDKSDEDIQGKLLLELSRSFHSGSS